MCTPNAVCVDNGLAASEASISLRTTTDECGHRTRSRPICHLSTYFCERPPDDPFDDRTTSSRSFSRSQSEPDPLVTGTNSRSILAIMDAASELSSKLNTRRYAGSVTRRYSETKVPLPRSHKTSTINVGNETLVQALRQALVRCDLMKQCLVPLEMCSSAGCSDCLANDEHRVEGISAPALMVIAVCAAVTVVAAPIRPLSFFQGSIPVIVS